MPLTVGAIADMPVIAGRHTFPIREPRASRLVSTHPPPPLLVVSPVVAVSEAPVDPAVPVVYEEPVVAVVPAVASAAPFYLSVEVLVVRTGPKVDSTLSPVRGDHAATVFPALYSSFVDPVGIPGVFTGPAIVLLLAVAASTAISRRVLASVTTGLGGLLVRVDLESQVWERVGLILALLEGAPLEELDAVQMCISILRRRRAGSQVDFLLRPDW